MKDNKENDEFDFDTKALSNTIINELDNLTPEQLKQLLDALENGIIIKSPPCGKSYYLERK